MLGKYLQVTYSEKDNSKIQKEQIEQSNKRSYNKRIIENREDGGPVTRSKGRNTSDEIRPIESETNFDHHSTENIKTINLINYFSLMNPIELFKQRILIKKPNEIIK